jgi:hypothetical protein
VRRIRALALALVVVGASAAPVLANGRAQVTMPRIGGSLTLNDRIYGSTARITLLKVIDPATPSYPSKLQPRPGDRWVAIQIRIRGLRGQWIDGPSGDAHLVDTQQHRFGALPAGYGTVEVRMPGTTDLTPGQFVQGNLVFEVPTNASLRTFVYTPQGGDTGTWNLTR